MVLPIAVEVAPAQAAREHVAVLLSACSRAAADVECLPAAEVGTGGTRAVAIVTWHGDRRVVVEVGLRKRGRPIWRTRLLDFERSDNPIERWRTIGLVVGTLSRPEAEPSEAVAGSAPGVNSQNKFSPDADLTSPDADLTSPDADPTSPDADPTSPDAASRPETPAMASAPRRARQPKPRVKGKPRVQAELKPQPPVIREASRAASREIARAKVPAPRARAVLDLGGVIGPGLDGVRSGALARGRFSLNQPLSAVLAVRYLERPVDDPIFAGRWFTGGAGVGATAAGADLELTASVDARAEYFQVRARDGDREENQGRWLSGLGVGVNGGWMPTRGLGFFLGAEGAWMFGTTEVLIQDELVATDSPLQLGIEAGLRVRLW